MAGKLNEVISGGRATRRDEYDIFREILHLTTHELAHFFDAEKASHQADEMVGLLAWRQKKLIREFIASGARWKDVLGAARGENVAANNGPASPSAVTDIDNNEEEEYQMSISTALDMAETAFEGGRRFEIRYDKGRLTGEQVDVINAFAAALGERLSPGEKPEKYISVRPSGGEACPLLEIRRYEGIKTKEPGGKGTVDTSGDISGKKLDIGRMLGMTLVASLIDEGNKKTREGLGMIEYLRGEYLALTGIPVDGDEIFKAMMDLPGSAPFDTESSRYYSDMCRRIRSAA
jgi:hypothetical protein